ncbi:MAG: ABC transporter substrate-binding protein [Nostocaceae cyanobacterium]|nr:ABC transporter substrate-binding protein [Nostocaceae cyanobacterium]
MGVKIRLNLLALLAAIAVVLSAYFLLDIILPPPLGDGISSGEEILIKYTNLDKNTQEFQKLKEQKNFAKARGSEFKQEGSELCADPEPLIYLNNQNIPPGEASTIAVVAPIDSSVKPLALEMLRGVAQAQDEFNNSPQPGKKKYLRVMIANENDDDPNKASSKDVARLLLNEEEVLGVVGHFSSDATIEANEIYSNQLVAISPSSSMDINPNAQNNYFFRIAPNNKDEAVALANYISKTIKLSNTSKKIVIIYNNKSNYSLSLKYEFSREVTEKGWQVFPYEINEINRTANPFDEAENKNISVIMFTVNSSLISEALLPIPDINPEQKLYYLGGDAMYKPSRLKSNYIKKVQNMVVAIPWHYTVDLPKSKEFVDKAYKLWCQPKDNEEKITWLTATAYDATKVLIEAIKNTENPTRADIQKYIKTQISQDRPLIGVTGNISFKENGDLERESMLVQIKERNEGEEPKYVYELVK